MSIAGSTVVVPRGLAEVVDLLASATPTIVCAGGTDLVPRLRNGELPATRLALCGSLPELKRIAVEGDTLVIGAAATYDELATSPEVARHVPSLPRLVSTLANPRVRSRGTIGGHVCSARPRYDVMTLLVALDARARVESGHGRRAVAVSSFVLGERRTVLEPDEVLTALQLPIPPPGMAVDFERIGTSQGPVVNVAAILGPQGCSVVIGAVQPRTIIIGAGEALTGDIGTVAARAAAAAVSDNHVLASPEYRSAMAGVLTTRLLTRMTGTGGAR
jgi:CO/xanthine dehydrogenase FAD-binding subunit